MCKKFSWVKYSLNVRMSFNGVLLRYGARKLPSRCVSPFFNTSGTCETKAKVFPNLSPRRAVHTVNVSVQSWWPEPLVDMAQSAVYNIQLFTGLPWWASLMAAAVATKLVILPLDWCRAVNDAKLQLTAPEIRVRLNATQQSLLQKCKADNIPYNVFEKKRKLAVSY